MQARDFLDVATLLAGESGEACWRAAVGNAYYGLFLECRDIQVRWGRRPAPRHNVHADVRLRFRYSRHADLQQIADALEDLSTLRNQASYDMRPAPEFNSASEAIRVTFRARSMVALLDAIEADPVRRAAAIAALPP